MIWILVNYFLIIFSITIYLYGNLELHDYPYFLFSFVFPNPWKIFDVEAFRWWIIFTIYEKITYTYYTMYFFCSKYLSVRKNWFILAKIYFKNGFCILFAVKKFEKILFTLQINRKKVWPINYSVSKKTRNEGRVTTWNSNHISGDWQHPSWANKILHWISRLHFLFTHTRKE